MYNHDNHLISNMSGFLRITRELQNLSMSLRLVSLKSTFQKVTRIARDTIQELGKDVEFVKFENGRIGKVSLATSDFYTNALGEKVEETQWHNLVFFGKTVDIVEKYVEKGKEIAVEGKIVYRSCDDKEGIKHYITEIRVEELVMLGGK